MEKKMSLKETLQQNQVPEQNDSESQQTDKLTMSDVQKADNWSQTPEGQIRRFETAAALAGQNKEKTFVLDNQSYDAKYVQDFIQTGRSVDAKTLQTDFLLDTLQQSSKAGQTGKCYGKSFENGSDCFNVMNRIQQLRTLHKSLSEIESSQIDSKERDPQFSESMETIKQEIKKNAVSEFEYNGKKYDLSLDIPPEKQWRYFGNVNEEMTSPLDSETKGWLRKYAKNQQSPHEVLPRLYKVMEASGNPAIRSLKSDITPVGWIAKNSNHFTPDVIGTGGTLYLNNSSMIPAELAHAFRNENNTFGEASQFVRDGLKDILTLNSAGFTSEAQRKNYSDKDKMEYDAHEIVEPALNNYLRGKTPTIEQMYSQIDAERKKEGISYSQTSAAEEMTQKGYEQQKQETLQNQTLIATAKTR